MRHRRIVSHLRSPDYRLVSDFMQRLEHAKRNGGGTNCIGTAMFLAGSKTDTYVSEEDAFDALTKNGFIECLPRIGALVTWEKDVPRDNPHTPGCRIIHAGVVVNAIDQEYFVTHRTSYEGEMQMRAPLGWIGEGYISKGYSLGFYRLSRVALAA